MRPTQVGTTIAAVTVFALGGITAYKGNDESQAAASKDAQEQGRSKNQVTIAREVIANEEQYPSYSLSPEMGGRVPELDKSRLTSFRSSTTGFYYSIARLGGEMQVMAIYSGKEIRTTINLLREEKQHEIR